MIHEFVRKNGVHHGFDAGIRPVGIEHGGPLLAHHLGIRQGGQFREAEQDVEFDGGETFLADRREIAAASFDVKDFDFIAKKIRNRAFGGSIASTMKHQRGIAAQQTGAVDPLCQKIRPTGGGIIGIPETLHILK